MSTVDARDGALLAIVEWAGQAGNRRQVDQGAAGSALAESITDTLCCKRPRDGAVLLVSGLRRTTRRA